MAIRKQVQCVTKKGGAYEPHSIIAYIGGTEGNGKVWSVAESVAVNQIDAGIYNYFVEVDGKEVDVIVANYKSHKYVKTEADGYEPNNLLSLPTCNPNPK